MKAKTVLERSGRRSEAIPVPREFSSECGFCCKANWEEKDEIEKILRESGVEIDSIYRWVKDDERERKKKFRFV
jgi:hypothetical protein